MTCYKNFNDELFHFGIKGMKWGVRRFQNEDRTWTEAGKERYNDGSSRKSSSNQSNVSSENSNSKQSSNTERNAKIAKTLRNVAIGAVVIGGTVAAGMAVAKYVEKQNLNKVIASSVDNINFWRTRIAKTDYYQLRKTGGVFQSIADKMETGTSATLQKLNSISGGTQDMVFGSGDHFERYVRSGGMTVDGLRNLRVGNFMYDASNSVDAMMYNYYGSNIQADYKLTIDVLDRFSSAGLDTGRSVLGDIVKGNRAFIKRLENTVNTYGQGMYADKALYREAKNALLRGDYSDASVYTIFNQSLAGTSTIKRNSPLYTSFYNEMLNRGHAGARDYNDVLLSSYDTITPTILIDKGKVAVNGVLKAVYNKTSVDKAGQRHATNSMDSITQMDKAYDAIKSRLDYDEYTIYLKKNWDNIAKSTETSHKKQAGYSAIAKASGVIGGSVAGLTAIASNTMYRNAISNYKQEHPNTEMSDDEILKSLGYK